MANRILLCNHYFTRGTLIFLLLYYSLFLSSYSYATHLRGGEITTERISCQGRTFRIILTVYTTVRENQNIGELNFGDGSPPDSFNSFTSSINLGNDIQKNQYTVTHTFVANGAYTISYTEHSRNETVLNMSNSPNTLFYIETLLILDPFNGCHQGSVKFLNSPIFFAQKGESFRLSLAAIDPNDFKLRYAITPNKQGQGIIVDDYFLPEDIKIDSISGLLVWDNPQQLGEFNFAVIIKQFKENILQGFVVRDFQVIVGIHNQEPIISVTDNNGIPISLNERILILPTELLEIKIEAEDMQSDSINIKAISELLIQSEDATFQLTGTPNNKLGSFSFLSNFDLDRGNPYIISFRATSYLDGSSLNKDYSYAIYTRNVEDRVIVSLEDFRKMDLPTLVPNPIQDYFMVRTVGVSYGMLKIFDLQGKLLNQIQWIGNTLIPRSKLGLSNGTYIYRLNSRVSFLKQGKIVIQ